MTHKYHTRPQDKQAGLYGKVENDFNKIGDARPTQKNEGLRTPQSRSDRESQVGSNQSQVRRSGPATGQKPGPRGKR